MRRALPIALALSALPAFTQATAPAKLDDGLLDPAWFGSEVAMAPAPALKMDFAWLRPGFSLKGKRLQMMPWQYCLSLDPKADERSQVSAGFYTQRMPRLLETYFRSQWGEGVEVGTEPGDYQLVGRVVEANIQSLGGRFIMGIMAAQNFTFDLKIVDRDGKVVAALHHRWGMSGGVDPFRFLDLLPSTYEDLQPFMVALAPLSPRAPELPKVFELNHEVLSTMVGSSEMGKADLHYGCTSPLLLRGKTLKIAPWRVSDEGMGKRAWTYGVCAEQMTLHLSQTLAPLAPANGEGADFTLKGILRTRKDDVLYQASLVDKEGKEVFRLEQVRSADRVEHLDGRDPEFLRVLIGRLTAGEEGFKIPQQAPNPPSLIPAEAAAIAKQDAGFWMEPGLNLSRAHIELAPWPAPSPFLSMRTSTWLHAVEASRVLPGYLGASFIVATKYTTKGVGTIVSEGATHRLEGQIVAMTEKRIGVMEARLVEIATNRPVWAMRLKLDEASGRDCQAHDSMEQLVDKQILPYFSENLYAPLPKGK